MSRFEPWADSSLARRTPRIRFLYGIEPATRLSVWVSPQLLVAHLLPVPTKCFVEILRSQVVARHDPHEGTVNATPAASAQSSTANTQRHRCSQRAKSMSHRTSGACLGSCAPARADTRRSPSCIGVAGKLHANRNGDAGGSAGCTDAAQPSGGTRAAAAAPVAGCDAVFIQHSSNHGNCRQIGQPKAAAASNVWHLRVLAFCDTCQKSDVAEEFYS